jgi:UDP-N-acetylmuramoyl-tripeptide--D-alanyl-D-alanine ligase
MGALRIYKGEKPFVVVVGGSVGKTSTKEALAEVLTQSGRPVRKTFGNLATDSGVPLSLLGFQDPPAGIWGWLEVIFRSLTARPKLKPEDKPLYVLEYSSDIEGETDFLVERIAPDVAVYCTLVPVHMEQYGTEEVMVRETLRLHSTLRPEGFIVANADDPHQAKAFKGTSAVQWYGKTAKDGVQLTNSKMQPVGLELTYTLEGSEKTVQTAVLADYQLLPILASIAVASKIGMTEKQIHKGVEGYSLPPGRGKLISGKNEMTIIDDTANSSPEAVKAGLQVLERYGGERRKVAILGSMNELGELALESHREVAAEAARKADFFIAVGKYSGDMLRSARDAGLSPTQMIAFPSPVELTDHLFQLVHRNDVIFIKASQNGMFLERIVKQLMAKPEDAQKLLVRQGAFWQ